MTGGEARVEAALGRLLPEIDIRDLDPRQRRIFELQGAWRECFDNYGEEHGATLGCLLALVREAWRDPHLYIVCKDFCAGPRPYCMHSDAWSRASDADVPTDLAILITALEEAAP